jgi:chemotaxis signal transduction protein
VSADDLQIAGTAAELRRAFDASFISPVSVERGKLEDVLAIRVGGDPYALRLSEIAGLHANRQPLALPSPVGELLGLVAIRGLLAPAYDLAALLGYPRAPNSRWLVLVRVPQFVALAFSSLESHLRIPEDSFAQHENGNDGHNAQHLRGSIRNAGVLRPLIYVPGVLKTIEALTRPASQGEER